MHRGKKVQLWEGYAPTVDLPLVSPIVALNELGYTTEECCRGAFHHREAEADGFVPYAYVVFMGGTNGPRSLIRLLNEQGFHHDHEYNGQCTIAAYPVEARFYHSKAHLCRRNRAFVEVLDGWTKQAARGEVDTKPMMALCVARGSAFAELEDLCIQYREWYTSSFFDEREMFDPAGYGFGLIHEIHAKAMELTLGPGITELLNQYFFKRHPELKA